MPAETILELVTLSKTDFWCYIILVSATCCRLDTVWKMSLNSNWLIWKNKTASVTSLYWKKKNTSCHLFARHSLTQWSLIFRVCCWQQPHERREGVVLHVSIHCFYKCSFVHVCSPATSAAQFQMVCGPALRHGLGVRTPILTYWYFIWLMVLLAKWKFPFQFCLLLRFAGEDLYKMSLLSDTVLHMQCSQVMILLHCQLYWTTQFPRI